MHSDLFYTASLVEVQNRSDAAKPHYPLFSMHTEPVLTGFYLFKLATAIKVDVIVKRQRCVMEISIIVTGVVIH